MKSGGIFDMDGLPFDTESDVVQHQDVVLLLLLMEGLFSDAVKERNYRFYEERTLHDSSLNKNTHCVLACRLGLYDQAETFFEGSGGRGVDL